MPGESLVGDQMYKTDGSSYHGKVGQSSESHDQGGDDMVQTLRDWDRPCKTGENDGRDEHEDKDNPGPELANHRNRIGQNVVCLIAAEAQALCYQEDSGRKLLKPS